MSTRLPYAGVKILIGLFALGTAVASLLYLAAFVASAPDGATWF